jgi:hypothetical protein
MKNSEGEGSMKKPVLVVTTHYIQAVEERIDLNYDARRNPNDAPFSRKALLLTSDGADALFITPATGSTRSFSRMSRLQ